MIKVAICDDDCLTRNSLAAMLRQEYGSVMEIFLYEEAEQLLKIWEMEKKQEDIVLMDIRFARTDGISVAKKLQERYRKVRIIFITGYIDYATEIFRAEPIFFLTKPISRDRLTEAVEKALARIKEERRQQISLSMKGCIMRVDVNEIRYIESNKRTSYIYREEDKIVLNRKLGELERQLPDSFLRCHQSFLVNMRYIRSFTGREIELADGRKIPVSRPKQSVARESFLRYLGNVL